MNLRALFTFALLAGAALAPSFALASGAAPVHMSLNEILWDLGIKVLNVGILGFFAFKYLSGPLNRLVEARSDKIREELDAAKSARLEAEERLRAFREKTARVDDEIEELRKQTCGDIDREQKLILQEAKQAAEHIRQHARDTIRQEVLKARDDLHREASRLAADLAEDIIRKNIDSGDQDRLVKEYVTEMEAAQ
jgi:F-type H+-transporting ATPase subunit b